MTRNIPTQLFFLRHGETDWNALGLTMGQANVALNRTGKQQAFAVREQIERYNVTSVWRSPLKRCQQTMQLAVPGLSRLPVSVLPGLAERNWGVYQGKSAVLRPSFYDSPPSAEPFDAFVERVRASISLIGDTDRPLVVSHSGVFRALCQIYGLETQKESVPNALPLQIEPGQFQMCA